MKEFLSEKGVEFDIIDVLNDPVGREKLLALGLRQGPIVAKGSKYVFGQNFDDVVEFVGLRGAGYQRLPSEELIKKWILALRTAQRYLRQMPNDRINELAIPNRPRTIRQVGHHLIRIAEAFLEASVDGVEYTMELYQTPPKDGTFTTGDEIARYGDAVIARLQQWWDGLDDRSCQRKIKTYYGMQSIYVVYERSTWHSAQHARQLAAVLERFGIEPDGRLTDEDLAGLPMPEELW